MGEGVADDIFHVEWEAKNAQGSVTPEMVKIARPWPGTHKIVGAAANVSKFDAWAQR